MDEKNLQKLGVTLNAVAFAPKEIRQGAPTVLTLAQEIAGDIESLQRKLDGLSELLHKAMGSMLDAANITK